MKKGNWLKVRYEAKFGGKEERNTEGREEGVRREGENVTGRRIKTG